MCVSLCASVCLSLSSVLALWPTFTFFSHRCAIFLVVNLDSAWKCGAGQKNLGLYDFALKLQLPVLPPSSELLYWLRFTRSRLYHLHQCRFGASSKKPTTIASNSLSADKLTLLCNHRVKHEGLIGRTAGGDSQQHQQHDTQRLCHGL